MGLTRITSDGITDGTITGTDLATNIDLVDNQKLRLGTGNDLQIYHNGSDSYIQDAGTGGLNIAGSNVYITSADVSENIAAFNQNGSVELFHNNSKKFETMSTGVDVHGTLRADEIKLQGDNQILKIGGADDLQLYHSGQIL